MPQISEFFIKKGDRLPELQRTLSDSSGPVDLTGATVRFRMRNQAKETITDAAAVVVDATAGVVKYAWQSGDTAASGVYEGEFRVTFADFRVLTFPNRGWISITVNENIDAL